MAPRNAARSAVSGETASALAPIAMITACDPAGSPPTTARAFALFNAAHYDAGDVFAMPCRTRRGGLEVEGLGIVFLEASATGLPVVAGRSGGSPDAVLDGRTGHVVDGTSVSAVADAVAGLLADRRSARDMGSTGRAWVEQEWRWDVLAARLRSLLEG